MSIVLYCRKMSLQIVTFNILFDKCKYVTMVYWLVKFEPFRVDQAIGMNLMTS
jgi:hypothetical protein